MPIKLPPRLPAAQTLENEHIFTMDEATAAHQDIRPLRIAVLNLMPTKIATETQLCRVLSNTPLQIELTLLGTETYRAKNTPAEHMEAFYKNFSGVRDEKFDGLIITGAPVENLDFEQVHYWDELCAVMDWSRTHVYTTLHICWAAQAGLYHHFGVPKYPLAGKLSGIFEHEARFPRHPLLRGFDERFLAPHSRYTEVRREDIDAAGRLQVLSESREAGVYIAASSDSRMFFVTGHSEYDAETLKFEYERDLAAGKNPGIPHNYFPGDDPARRPLNVWRAHANLLFSNWLNYFVYQETPYDLNRIGE